MIKMCGIMGFIPFINCEDWQMYMIRALRAISLRGNDSIGLFVLYEEGWAETYKTVGNIDDFLGEHGDRLYNLEKVRHVLGVARAQPLQEVLPDDNLHNPPFLVDKFAIVHNGIISNDKEIIEGLGLKMKSKNDTEVLLRALLTGKDGKPTNEIQHWRLPQLKGCASFIISDEENEMIHFYRDFKPLHYANFYGNRLLISTENMGYKAAGLHRYDDNISVKELPAGFWGKINWYGDLHAHIRKAQLGKEHYMADIQERSVIAVCSGGIDSVTTAAYFIEKGYKVLLMFFAYGQKAFVAEARAVFDIAKHYDIPFKIVDLTWLGDLKGSALTDDGIPIPKGIRSVETNLAWTPGRNLVMLSIAAAHADRYGYEIVTFGANLQENTSPYPDNESEFARKMHHAIQAGTLNHVGLLAPLANLMKEDIIRMGTEYGVPYELTHSCDVAMPTDPERNPPFPFLFCGQCGCCYSSAIAFTKAGIDDPRKFKYESLGPDIIKDLERYGKKEWYAQGLIMTADGEIVGHLSEPSEEL